MAVTAPRSRTGVLLGIDGGTESVRAGLFNAANGQCASQSMQGAILRILSPNHAWHMQVSCWAALQPRTPLSSLSRGGLSSGQRTGGQPWLWQCRCALLQCYSGCLLAGNPGGDSGVEGTNHTY